MALQDIMTQQGWTPTDISTWVNTQTPEHVRSMLGQYGVSPTELTSVYNVGAGTSFTPEQAQSYVGMPATTTPTASPTLPATLQSSPIGSAMTQVGATPQDIFSWVNTQIPQHVQRMMGQYGVTPEGLTTAYNIGSGGTTSFTPEQARTYLGYPQLPTPETPELFNVEDLVQRGIYPQSRTQIPGMEAFMSQLTPLLTQLMGALPQQAEQLPGTLQDMYGTLMQQGLGPQAFQGILNQLAGRNILDSSVASDALAKTATGIMQNVATQAYPSFLSGLQAQMQLPSTLGSLAQLGQVAESTSPLAPYELMAQMLM